MIEINNINISYGSHRIIKESHMCIQDGVLTGISGPSGSGKTTLFYIIGLISSIRGYEYFYNGVKLDIEDDNLKSSMRKKNIGFIFQDKNLHEYLSIEDNLKLYSYISGVEYTHEKAIDVLEKVHIHLDMTTITKTLSGGEKQRLAIACTLMKNPELIIADEPTSALDDDNAASVIDALKEIADEGKMVIIASHNENVLNQCQIKYYIEDQNIICHQDIEKAYKRKPIERFSLSHSFYSWYSQFSFGRKKYEKFLMIFIPSLIISLCILGLSLKNGLLDYYENIINDFSINEVLVENGNTDISSKGLSLLKQIEGVEHTDYVYSDIIDQLKINNQIINLDSSVFIQTYFDFQKDDFQLDHQYENGDVYISNSLAKKLNLKDSPIIEVNNDILNKSEFHVGGIFKQDYHLTQTKDQQVIYIPFEYFHQSASHTVLLKLENFQYLDGISDKINEINQNYNIILSQSKYLSQISFLNMFRENFTTFLIVLLSSVIILLSIMNIFTINNQKYEITVLKANGLSKKEIIWLMMIVTIRLIITSLIMISIILVIENIIMLLLAIPSSIFSLQSICITIGLVIGVYVFPNLLATLYLNHFDPEEILRF